MNFVRYLLFVGAALAMAMPACAQRDPFFGREQYPEFRNISGLSGGGYGLDANGYGSLSGPTAFSTPIAYVLGHDQVRMGIAKMSFSSALHLDDAHTNGSAFVTYGHTFGSFNIAVSDFIKSARLDQAYNLQLQYIPPRGSKLSGSIGVQDVLGLGGAAGEGIPNDRWSRSLFGVLTYRVDTFKRPFYVSAGWGTHRFRKGFGSVSYQTYPSMRTWLEWDGYGFNEGVLLALRPRRGLRSPEVDAVFGYIRGRYLTVGTGLGF